MAVLSPLVDPAAALSLLGGTAAALSLCAVAAMAIGALIVQALIAATDMVLARQRSARLQPGLTTAVAAGMTPTATGFARAGTSRTARRRRWPMVLEAGDEIIGIAQRAARAANALTSISALTEIGRKCF